MMSAVFSDSTYVINGFTLSEAIRQSSYGIFSLKSFSEKSCVFLIVHLLEIMHDGSSKLTSYWLLFYYVQASYDFLY